MLVISYVYDKYDEFKTEAFPTEEEAKVWFINELFDHNLLYYWYDEDNEEEYEVYDDDGEAKIRECLMRTGLERIIELLKKLHKIKVNILNL